MRNGRSSAIAAVLSFVWPGLGQWYEGRGQRALLYAVPVLVVAVVLIAELLAGPAAFAARMLNPTVALTMLGLIALIGIWRAASVVEAAARPTGVRGMRAGCGRSRSSSLPGSSSCTASPATSPGRSMTPAAGSS